ncbi:MAG: hypothetical protein AAFQ32_06830 [Pseudomonadota bacterium]
MGCDKRHFSRFHLQRSFEILPINRLPRIICAAKKGNRNTMQLGIVMSNLQSVEQDVAYSILQMRDDQVMSLLRGRHPDQKLSFIVQRLNSSVLDGTPKESEQARDALGRLGFI